MALFPDCREASELVYELFCDPWTIYDNRVALQQNIDEWDDRPWQQRRRLALSYRFMSRWEGKYWPYAEESDAGATDVLQLLEMGKMELLGAYCLGDEECTDYAWAIFVKALNQTDDPHQALFWIGYTYADLGFFADAAEVLAELCARFDNAQARRLLAEVLWWRDNAYRIPWIPPAGDRSRYDRMMQHIEPDALTTQEIIQHFRNAHQKERPAAYHPALPPAFVEILAQVLPDEKLPIAPLRVDWHFLDEDDGQPGEPAEWVKNQIERLMRQEKDELVQEMIRDMEERHRWTRNIRPPSTPRRYDPNEPPFDPNAYFGDFGDDEDL